MKYSLVIGWGVGRVSRRCLDGVDDDDDDDDDDDEEEEEKEEDDVPHDVTEYWE